MNNKFYLLGIGGISMSAIAKYLIRNGFIVKGYDLNKSEQTDELFLLGVEIDFKDEMSISHIRESDIIIYSDAILEEDIKIIEAKKLKKTLYRRVDFLKRIMDNFSSRIAIAGSHGKTTCTAMCAHIFKETGVPFAAHIGGEDRVFGNFYMTGKDFFITEACEYKKNLLKLKVDTAVLLNIDKDHMECYKDENDLIETFHSFLDSAEVAFLCLDDNKSRLLGDNYGTFGIESVRADYRATEIRQVGEKYSFTVQEYGKQLCRIKLSALGRCNIYNALAAFAVTRRYGFNEQTIKNGLEKFEAVKRRFEKIGEYLGTIFICDYAHHPREILATYKTAKRICKGKLYVVFQPHTYSRTRLLMSDFVFVLRKIENLIIYKTYSARENYEKSGSGETLSKNIGNCLYIESVRELKVFLTSTLHSNDVVLFLGAGDIYYVVQYLLRELNK